MTEINYAYGAFAGMLVGDASGAPLEFYQKKINSKLVKKAMRMPGGGVWNVGKGQITDDGELALSLGQALVDKNPSKGFPRNAVFRSYHQWYESQPFDIGNTCRVAFHSSQPNPNLECLQNSQSNGSLMRIIPLPIWARNEGEKKIAKYAREDALLSHPNPITQDTNVVYSLGIAYLLQNPGDNIGCYEYLEDYVSKSIKTEVKKWFFEADKEPKYITTNIGYVKWAFQLAIYHLKNGSGYEEAIYSTLMKGGDTDTNAAIVGGMMGALNGLDGIPNYMLDPVMSFDPTDDRGEGRLRPKIYRARNCFSIVDDYYGLR